MQTVQRQLSFSQWLKWHALTGGQLSQARHEESMSKARKAERGWNSWGGRRAPSLPARRFEERCNLPTGLWGIAPKEVGFGGFWGSRNHQFLFTTHYSTVVDLQSLGMTIFGQIGLRSSERNRSSSRNSTRQIHNYNGRQTGNMPYSFFARLGSQCNRGGPSPSRWH